MNIVHTFQFSKKIIYYFLNMASTDWWVDVLQKHIYLQ